jgi:hypothetical protein
VVRTMGSTSVWVAEGEGLTFHALPPPSQEEVERLLAQVRRRVLKLLTRLGKLPAEGPEDALEALQAASLQHRLPWHQLEVKAPPRKVPRCAQLEGFSLHANTHLHANDREGLERLCRYGARGPLAMERLSRSEDGRLAYRMKRPLPNGTTHLLLTPLQLVKKLAALVPPKRANLTRFHGLFAPGAALRQLVVPKPPEEVLLQVEVVDSPARPSPAAGPPRLTRTPRLCWATLLQRTFGHPINYSSRQRGHRPHPRYSPAAPALRAGTRLRRRAAPLW